MAKRAYKSPGGIKRATADKTRSGGPKRPGPGPGGAYPDYDPMEYDEIKMLQDDLIADNQQRDRMLDEFDQYWTMEPAKLPPKDTNETAVTISPDSSNKLVGAWRLLSSTAPEFSLPKEQNRGPVEAISSTIERAAKMMWAASGKILGLPQEKEAVIASLQTGGVEIGLSNLLAEEAKQEKESYRMKRARVRTPILFEAWSPRYGYPLRDRWGLSGHLRRYETTCAAVKADWPELDIAYLKGKKRTDKVTLRDWIDENYRAVSIEGDFGPFYWFENEKHIIPRISQLTEGSMLYAKPEHQARPFLFNAHKSELPRRQNLMLTAVYTLVQAVAATALWDYQAPPGKPEKTPDIQILGALSYIRREQGESFSPFLAKGVLDPAMIQGLQLAKDLVSESTIYSQALGEPLGANAPFSMVALLHQAGRLPLTNPKMLIGWALADAMELGFYWLKETGKNISISMMGESVDLVASQIPDDLQFAATLEIDLPQDLREQASLVSALRGVMPLRWLREHLIRGAGQSETLQGEIWSEEMANLMAMQLFETMQAVAQERRAIKAGGLTEEEPTEAGAGSTRVGETVQRISPNRTAEEIPAVPAGPTGGAGTPAPARPALPR